MAEFGHEQACIDQHGESMTPFNRMTTSTNYSRQLLLLWLSVATGAASALEPCRPKGDYLEAVDKTIDGAIGRPAELAITVLPSFKPEYGLRMVEQDLFLVELSPSLWAKSVVSDGPRGYHYDFRNVNVGTSIHKASISPELAIRIRQKYAAAVSTTNISRTLGRDGTTYRFVLDGLHCGQTWSPEPTSANGKLVELAKLLVAHARQSTDPSISLSEEDIARVLDRME